MRKMGGDDTSETLEYTLWFLSTHVIFNIILDYYGDVVLQSK